MCVCMYVCLRNVISNLEQVSLLFNSAGKMLHPTNDLSSFFVPLLPHHAPPPHVQACHAVCGG
jgi:hypothetical protein